MYCIESKELVYRFVRNETVLDHVNMQVPDGAIYGFLGPNGAGKTTTIRLLLGLLRKQEGEIRIFGNPFEENRIEILRKIGSLVESPSLYAHLTARENLRIFQKIFQCPMQRIDEVLAIVGLSGTGKKKAGKFSLGMKQRLGIAMALLHDPTLLILDEPTNGLDPNGIMEIRELLKKLNSELKTTILISSHLLAEIEKLATHVGIINKGKLLFQGTLEDLHLKQKQTSVISFITNNQKKSFEIFSSFNLLPVMANEEIIIENIPKQKIAMLNQQLVNNNIEVYQINPLKNDLESIFMDLTKN